MATANAHAIRTIPSATAHRAGDRMCTFYQDASA
jgi:hypothetical protein